MTDFNGRNTRLKGFIAFYAMFLAVGSLYPFANWAPLSTWSADFLQAAWPRYITRTDLATNLLVYIPLGYALARWYARPGHLAASVVAGTLGGIGFSLIMESGQQLLPGRIASNLDLLVNSLGAVTGALLTLHHGRWLRAGRALHRWRSRTFHAGIHANLGLALLVLWFLAQFSLLPFPGIGWLGLHLRPIDTPPGGLSQINFPWLAAVVLEIMTLGAFAATLLRPGRYVNGMLLLTALAFIAKLLAATILIKLKVRSPPDSGCFPVCAPARGYSAVRSPARYRRYPYTARGAWHTVPSTSANGSSVCNSGRFLSWRVRMIQFLRLATQIDHGAALLERGGCPARGWRRRRWPARCHAARQLIDHTDFAATKPGSPSISKMVGMAHAAAGDDFMIGIEKRQAALTRQNFADSGLARTHQADQKILQLGIMAKL
jgi:VanZ family protein